MLFLLASRACASSSRGHWTNEASLYLTKQEKKRFIEKNFFKKKAEYSVEKVSEHGNRHRRIHFFGKGLFSGGMDR